MSDNTITTRISDDIRGIRFPDGTFVDVGVILSKEEIAKMYTAETPSLETVMDGKTERRVHLRFSCPTWDMMREAGLCPQVFGKFTFEASRLVANEFVARDNTTKYHLVAQAIPVKAEGGLPAAPSSAIMAATPERKAEKPAVAIAAVSPDALA